VTERIVRLGTDFIEINFNLMTNTSWIIAKLILI